MREITHGMKLDRYKNHDVEVVIDKLVVAEKDDRRLKQSVATAMRQGDGLMMILDAQSESIRHYSKRLMCPVTGLSYREPAPHNFSFINILIVDAEMQSFLIQASPFTFRTNRCFGKLFRPFLRCRRSIFLLQHLNILHHSFIGNKVIG